MAGIAVIAGGSGIVMDENLVGYLLQALDRDEEAEIEAHLQAHPDTQERVDLLRQALAPLEAAADEWEPPADLRIRTLARVAEYRTRELLSYRVPAPPPRSPASPRTWWRRADVLIAASILIFASSLILPGLNTIRMQYNITACQNNLRGFYQALMAYSDHHQGALPMVEERPPRNYAGIVIPALREGGYLTDAISVNCPASGFQHASDVTIESLDEERQRDPGQYEKDILLLSGCYAYPLGYRENNQHFGVRRVPGYDMLPIMADKPPFSQQWGEAVWTGNSPNHGAKGQNVLFLGGLVIFSTSRNVGIGGDDIYVNSNGLPLPGIGMADSVLVPGNFRAGDPDN
jgi:hypothetical protein